MKPLILTTLSILFFFPTLAQSSRETDVRDMDGFQYKTVHIRPDSSQSVVYYSRQKDEMIPVCAIKSRDYIKNYKDLFDDLYNAIPSETPKVRCGIRKFTFAFVYGNGLYDEIRIIQSDYEIKDSKALIARLSELIKKALIVQDDERCFYLFEINLDLVGMCNIVRYKPEIKYKN